MPTRTGYLEVDGRYFPLHRKKANDANGGCKCIKFGERWNQSLRAFVSECQPECSKFTEPCVGCGRKVALDENDICGRCYVKQEFGGGQNQSKLQRGGRIKGWL